MLDPFFTGRPSWYFQSRVVSNGVSLSNNITANVTVNPLVLPPGDYMISGTIGVNVAGSTTISQIEGGISRVTATLPANADVYNCPTNGEMITTFDIASTTLVGQRSDAVYFPAYRFQTDVATTLYLVVSCTFATSTMTAFGSFQATPMFP